MFFGRMPDGAVRIVKFSREPHVMVKHNKNLAMVPTEYPEADGEFLSVEVILDLRVPAEQWASIVASVSALGEGEGRFYTALHFHNAASPDEQKG